MITLRMCVYLTPERNRKKSQRSGCRVMYVKSCKQDMRLNDDEKELVCKLRELITVFNKNRYQNNNNQRFL